jgi:hypothetical protein
MGLSIGVSEWSEGKTLDEILDIADREMYASKSTRVVERTPLTQLLPKVRQV